MRTKNFMQTNNSMHTKIEAKSQNKLKYSRMLYKIPNMIKKIRLIARK